MALRVTDEAHRQEVEHAKRALRRHRAAHGADGWVLLGKRMDVLTGVEEDIWWDAENDRYAIGRKDHYRDAILRQNAEEKVANLNRRAGEMQKVASIPMGAFWDKFAQPMIDRDHAKVRKLLNDPDNAAFRTWQGRV